MHNCHVYKLLPHCLPAPPRCLPAPLHCHLYTPTISPPCLPLLLSVSSPCLPCNPISLSPSPSLVSPPSPLSILPMCSCVFLLSYVFLFLLCISTYPSFPIYSNVFLCIPPFLCFPMYSSFPLYFYEFLLSYVFLCISSSSSSCTSVFVILVFLLGLVYFLLLLLKY